MDGESRVQSHQSLAEDRSESKVLVGMKRDAMEGEETSESSHKRVKLLDFRSVKAQSGIGGCNTVHQDINSGSGALGSSANVCPVGVMDGADVPACIQESSKILHYAKETKNRGLDLDLNAEDMSSSINNDHFYPFKNYENLKSRDDSECASSMGPLDEKDSMRVWKGLKQNNYMSTPYGAKPMPAPKTRGRKKNNNDVMKRKIELARKEQVDRFAKVAAPSGLLNGLNPGIINHVRNSKQVHSIIEALVKSEQTENRLCSSKPGNHVKNGKGELTDSRSGQSCGDTLLERRQMRDYALFSKSCYWNSKVTRGDDDAYIGDGTILERMTSQGNVENKDDVLALKLSSSITVASENASCLSNEESGNHTSVNSLSVKAANVASQWLDLLNQDIKGRLAALRRSKRRVQAVITTELPHLLSREFSSNLEKDSYTTKGSTLSDPDKASADAHAVRWTTLFEQMDKALSEEESHMENWLNQVKEMQLHCERGLYSGPCNASQQTDPTGNDNRSGEAHNLEKDLAVRAAAASIYSTCNFSLTM